MEKGARSTLVKPSAKRASFRWYVLEPLGSFSVLREPKTNRGNDNWPR